MFGEADVGLAAAVSACCGWVTVRAGWPACRKVLLRGIAAWAGVPVRVPDLTHTPRARLLVLQVVLGVLGCPNLPQGQVCDEDGGSAAVQRSNDEDVGESCATATWSQCAQPGSQPCVHALAASKQGAAVDAVSWPSPISASVHQA